MSLSFVSPSQMVPFIARILRLTKVGGFTIITTRLPAIAAYVENEEPWNGRMMHPVITFIAILLALK